MEIRLPPKIAQTALVAAIITLQGAVAGAQAQQSWLLTGNPRTNPAQDFLGTRDNQPLAFRTNNAERLRVDTSGNVGIGTGTPNRKLSVNGVIETTYEGIYFGGQFGVGGSDYNYAVGARVPSSLVYDTVQFHRWRVQTDEKMTLDGSGNLGIGTTSPLHMLQVGGGIDGNLGFDGSDGTPNAGYIRFGNNTGWKFHFTRQREQGGGAPLNTGTTGALMTIQDNGNVGIGTMNPRAKLEVAGMVRTNVLQITGGSDLAEPFAASGFIKPGMVVAIDPERPGKLRIANKPYDRTVAGIVSGADGISPGLTMQHQGTVRDGSLPVALTGRVYCWADASNGPIRPGDLLTSSGTPGHAMKVTNHAKAHGATIGKAMTKLEQGEGLVLVLVALQ
jgi:hypothetical protein